MSADHVDDVEKKVTEVTAIRPSGEALYDTYNEGRRVHCHFLCDVEASFNVAEELWGVNTTGRNKHSKFIQHHFVVLKVSKAKKVTEVEDQRSLRKWKVVNNRVQYKDTCPTYGYDRAYTVLLVHSLTEAL